MRSTMSTKEVGDRSDQRKPSCSVNVDGGGEQRFELKASKDDVARVRWNEDVSSALSQLLPGGKDSQ